MNMGFWITQKQARDSSAMEGATADLPASGPGTPPPLRGSIFLISNKSNPKTNPTIKLSPGARGSSYLRRRCSGGEGEGVRGDASGPADFTAQLPSRGRGSTPRALLMLSGSCLDPIPQTSYFPGICPMVPTCQDGTLPGRKGESLQPLCLAS